MINLKVNGHEVEFKSWKFPAGEVGVKLPRIEEHEKVGIVLIKLLLFHRPPLRLINKTAGYFD